MTTEMEKFLADELALPAAPTTEELTDLNRLVDKQLALTRVIDEINGKLTEAKEMLRHVQEELIPQTMDTIGVKKFVLSNGLTVSIKEDVYASIRADFTTYAMDWLEAHNLGGIIKDEIKVAFAKGDTTKAAKVMAFCREQGFSADEKMSVHPMTLKATVKEQLAKGVEFPEEFFSIGPVRKAVIAIK